MGEAEDYINYMKIMGEDYYDISTPPIYNSKTKSHENQLLVKALHPDALVPRRATKFDAGYDLYALEDGYITQLERKMVSTGIALAIPEGHYGRIAPRSGLAVKQGIDVMAGVVDSSYRAEIKVVLINLNEEKDHVFRYKKGDRIAQLIVEKISTPPTMVVEELPPSDRGEGGFGSTGK